MIEPAPGLGEHLKKYNFKQEIQWAPTILGFLFAFGAISLGLALH
jgi:hypothetical protein